MNVFYENKQLFLDAAYRFLQVGYDSIKISKEEFIDEVNRAPEKFGIVQAAFAKRTDVDKDADSKIVIQGKFGGWNDLKSIIKECLDILDSDKFIAVDTMRGKYTFKLHAVTARFEIKIFRDELSRRDGMLIKHRF